MTTETPAAPAAPAAPAEPAAPATPAAPSGSLLDGVTPADPAAPAAPGAATPPAAGDDWLPEKFRVNGADGKLDEAASARKLAESYKALEAHKGPLPQAPASPDDYKIETINGPDGKPLDAEIVDGFTADPLFKAFAKDAHARGFSNEQMQFVVERYLNMAPQLIAADMQLSLDEAKAELGAVWKDEATMQRNLQGVVRAINGFGAEAADVPGSRARLMEKYGRDPDFIAFAAAVAGEMQEDKLPSQPAVASEADVESLQKSEAYWNKNHPDHGKVKGQVDAFYARKFGTKRR
jgi:hypothetical protein